MTQQARRLSFLFGTICVFVALVSWPLVLRRTFPDLASEVLPSFLHLWPTILFWFLIRISKIGLARLLGYVWLGWYFVGTANTLASGVVLGSYYSNLNLGPASFIYFFFACCYFLGVLLHEKVHGTGRGGIDRIVAVIPRVAVWGLMLFPFLWAISLYASLGYVPILSGESIVDEMYELDYGPVYPYGILIAVCSAYAAFRFWVEKNRLVRMSFFGLMLLHAFLSMMDGKRAIALVCFGSWIAIAMTIRRRKFGLSVIAIGIGLLASYVVVMIIRSGSEARPLENFYIALMLIGVEFRDFVFTVNNYGPGQIANYSWFSSSMGAMINGFALSILGFDKTALVSQGSAIAWSAIYETKFGIRTGIASELWFAYGFLGCFVIGVIGYFSSIVISKVRSARTEQRLIFWSTIYALLLLLVTSQSTFTFGVLPTVTYLYFGLFLVRRIARRGGWR